MAPNDAPVGFERWAWLIALNQLAGNDLRLREAWLAASLIEFLNQLAYNQEWAALNKVRD